MHLDDKGMAVLGLASVFSRISGISRRRLAGRHSASLRRIPSFSATTCSWFMTRTHPSETLQRFGIALGRRVHWVRFDKLGNKRGTSNHRAGRHANNVLCLFPHAMAEANAFYSRQAQEILFGYFRASRTNPGKNLPGQSPFMPL